MTRSGTELQNLYGALKEPWIFLCPKTQPPQLIWQLFAESESSKLCAGRKMTGKSLPGMDPMSQKTRWRGAPSELLLERTNPLFPLCFAVGEGLLRDPDPNSEWPPWRKGAQGTDTIQ